MKREPWLSSKETLTEMTETLFFFIGWLERLTVCLNKIWEYQKRNHINMHWDPQIVGADAVWPTRKTPIGMKRHLSVQRIVCSYFQQSVSLCVPLCVALLSSSKIQTYPFHGQSHFKFFPGFFSDYSFSPVWPTPVHMRLCTRGSSLTT